MNTKSDNNCGGIIKCKLNKTKSELKLKSKKNPY